MSPRGTKAEEVMTMGGDGKEDEGMADARRELEKELDRIEREQGKK